MMTMIAEMLSRPGEERERERAKIKLTLEREMGRSDSRIDKRRVQGVLASFHSVCF